MFFTKISLGAVDEGVQNGNVERVERRGTLKFTRVFRSGQSILSFRRFVVRENRFDLCQRSVSEFREKIDWMSV